MFLFRGTKTNNRRLIILSKKKEDELLNFLQTLKNTFFYKKNIVADPETLIGTVLFHLTFRTNRGDRVLIPIEVRFKEKGHKRVVEVIKDDSQNYGCTPMEIALRIRREPLEILRSKCVVTLEILELWERSNMNLEDILFKVGRDYERTKVDKILENVYRFSLL